MLHPDKIHNQNNQQTIVNGMQWKKQIILYTRDFAFARHKKYHSTKDFIPLFLEYKSEWKQNVENKGSHHRNQE